MPPQTRELEATAPAPFWHLFERSDDEGDDGRGGPGNDDSSLATDDATRADDPTRGLVCAGCHTLVTYPSERMLVQNAHDHVRVNPHGYVYHIECFRSAPGCLTDGEALEQWSWFPPNRWRLALCCGCLAHLGWHFTGPAGDFFGLIRGRIVEVSLH